MDRLGFFKQGLSSVMEAAQTVVGLKKAAESFTDAVDDALRDIAPEIGLHLPSLDAAMYDSPSGTLYEVGQIGYKKVEAGCYYDGTVYGTKPEELRQMARESGLKIEGLHLNKFYEKAAKTEEERDATDAESENGDSIVLSEECRAWWEKALATAAEMKCSRVVMSHLPEEMTEPIAIEYAHYFDAIGAMAQEQGIKFCFHPSSQALKPNNGVSMFDVVAQNSDADKVCFEIDTYEAAQAAVDMCDFLKRYGSRIVALQLHDYGIVGESGKIDFNKIVREASQCDIHDLFVEVSNFTLPPQNCVERSLQNVEMIDGVHY